MHKKSMELLKKCVDEICMTGNPTAEEWQNFYNCMKGCAAGICAEKDFKIIEAMEKADKEEEAMKMMGMPGYNHRRYASGRYAPAGRGHRSGYRPYLEMDDDEMIMGYLDDPDWGAHMRRGYTAPEVMPPVVAPVNPSVVPALYGYDGMDRRGTGQKYGRSFSSYRDARRHYTETKNPEHKAQMKESTEEVFDDIETMALDVWKDMTPEEKTKYKAKWQQIMQKMM